MKRIISKIIELSIFYGLIVLMIQAVITCAERGTLY